MNTEDSEFARIEREQAMRNVPDAIHHTDTSEPLMYIQGWNDCRQAMLAEQPAQREVCGYEHHEYRQYGAPGEVRIHAVLASQYKMPDGTIANDFQWLIDEYKSDPNTIKLLPLYTGPQAQPAPAAPVQEPCGWQFFQDGKWHNGMETNNHRANTDAAGVPVRDVYPSPPAQQEPLTDEEMAKAWAVADGEHNASASVKRRITRAIEAAHNIKENQS